MMKTQKTIAYALLFFTALACLSMSTAVEAQQGNLAPNFEGAFLSGEKFSLSDHIGKDIIALTFFTTDCGPCREEIPSLNDFYAAHAKENFVLAGIDVVENPAIVKSFVDRFKVGFPVMVDSGELTKSLGVTGYPTTVVIGVDGKIQFWNMNVIDVPGVLGPLLKTNHDLLAKGLGIPPEEFAKAQEQAGRHLLHVVPPEVKPVAGFTAEKARPNEVFDIRVARDTPQELDVDVDYYYAGDHGDTRIYIDCDPHMADGSAPFGMLPGTVEVGRHTAHAPLISYSGTPDGAVSTEITCVMASRLDSAQMATKTVPYKKTWGK